MNTTRRLAAFVAASLIISALAPGCSSNDKNSNPVSPATKELNSGNIPNKGNFSHTFANAGSYGYHCSIHPAMIGTITVVTGGLDSLIVLIVDQSASGFQAQAVSGVTSIKPGGLVHWHNQDVTHTVTSN